MHVPGRGHPRFDLGDNPGRKSEPGGRLLVDIVEHRAACGFHRRLLAKESTAPMDRVAAEIHQRAAARFANVPELSPLLGNEMVERGLQRTNPAQPSRCDLLGRVAEYGVIDVMEG